MTNEENLEIQSTRYIAPRVMRLTSGRIAIIPMMGRSPPFLIDGNDPEQLAKLIPTIDALEAEYYSRRDKFLASSAAAPKPLQPTLEDLA